MRQIRSPKVDDRSERRSRGAGPGEVKVTNLAGESGRSNTQTDKKEKER